MTPRGSRAATLDALDDASRQLIRLAAFVAAATEAEVRTALLASLDLVPRLWVEELLLQTYLFAGFPRALNAMREWRRLVPAAESKEPGTSSASTMARWRAEGEATCAAVYGAMYEPLRRNIRALHPALDDWMILEGYGKVLSRGGLDLRRRELCIVAACAASGQDRQLHSHLHGARNVGVSDEAIDETIAVLDGMLSRGRAKTVRLLWRRVRGK